MTDITGIPQAEVPTVTTFKAASMVLVVDPTTGESNNLPLREVAYTHVQALQGLTTLDGLSNSLAAFPTLSEKLGKVVLFTLNSALYIYRLAVSTSPAAPPDIIYPNDRQHGGVANRVWLLSSRLSQGASGQVLADTPPLNPVIGMTWIDTSPDGEGRVYLYFGNAWAEI